MKPRASHRPPVFTKQDEHPGFVGLQGKEPRKHNHRPDEGQNRQGDDDSNGVWAPVPALDDWVDEQGYGAEQKQDIEWQHEPSTADLDDTITTGDMGISVHKCFG